MYRAGIKTPDGDILYLSGNYRYVAYFTLDEKRARGYTHESRAQKVIGSLLAQPAPKALQQVEGWEQLNPDHYTAFVEEVKANS